MVSDSLIGITGLPDLTQQSLCISEACAKYPELMKTVGLDIIRHVRFQRDIHRETLLLFLEDRFQSVLRTPWLDGHRAAKRILDACRAGLNRENIERVLYDNGGPIAIIAFYLAMQQAPRTLMHMLEELQADELIHLAGSVKKMSIDASFTAWVRVKFENAKSGPARAEAKVPRRVRRSKRCPPPGGDSGEDRRESAKDGSNINTEPTEHDEAFSCMRIDIGGDNQIRDDEDALGGRSNIENESKKRKRTPSPRRDFYGGIRDASSLQQPLCESPPESLPQDNDQNSLTQLALSEQGGNKSVEGGSNEGLTFTTEDCLLDIDWPLDSDYFQNYLQNG